MANDGEADPPGPVIRTKELADCLIKVRMGILCHEDDVDGLDPKNLDTPCLTAYLEEAVEAKKGLQEGPYPTPSCRQPGFTRRRRPRREGQVRASVVHQERAEGAGQQEVRTRGYSPCSAAS